MKSLLSAGISAPNPSPAVGGSERGFLSPTVTQGDEVRADPTSP